MIEPLAKMESSFSTARSSSSSSSSSSTTDAESGQVVAVLHRNRTSSCTLLPSSQSSSPIDESSQTSPGAAIAPPSKRPKHVEKITGPWDLAKRGEPNCCICLELANRPVRLPCECASVMCFSCFESFMEVYSACLICRERIVPRLRRACKGQGLDVLIDQKLWTWIQEQFPDGQTGEEELSHRPVVLPPEPGELKREAELLVMKHLKEREAEEEATLKFLESLKKQGDADLEALERLKHDEELARRIQEQLENESASVNAKAGGPKKLTVASRRGTAEPEGQRCQVDDDVIVLSENDSKPRFPAAAKINPEADDVVVLSQNQNNNNNNQQPSTVKSTAPNTCKTWTCRVCTFAFTDVKWLRCDLCGASKHQYAATE